MGISNPSIWVGSGQLILTSVTIRSLEREVAHTILDNSFIVRVMGTRIRSIRLRIGLGGIPRECSGLGDYF